MGMILKGRPGLDGRSLVVIFLISIFSALLPQRASAVEVADQIAPFIESLEESPYTFNFLVEGLSSVHQIELRKGQTNQYQPFFNRLVLSATVGDASGRLKPRTQMSDIDFGTVAHEAYHAYMANFLQVLPEFASHKRFLARRAQNLYQEIPLNKRATTLEEAYASFIGWALQSHVHIVRTLGMSFPDETRQRCEGRRELLEAIWKKSWGAEINGYWYRDGVLEYWGEQMKGLGVLFSDGFEAWKRHRDGDGAHMVETDLQDLDRTWISQHLFEGKLSRSFEETFHEALANFSCAGLPEEEASSQD